VWLQESREPQAGHLILAICDVMIKGRLMILYWIIRLAVRHGVRDAQGRRSVPPESGSWDPARFGDKLS
jgi:hypothetical protein